MLLLLLLGIGFKLELSIEENPIFSIKFKTCFANLIKKFTKKI